MVQIASGGHHSACVTASGALLICGSYLHGKLGIEKRTSLSVSKFQQIMKIQNCNVKQVVCGDYHTVCLRDDGTIYTWGGALNDKLGKRQSMISANLPGLVTPLKSRFITQVACGDFHSMALEDNG